MHLMNSMLYVSSLSLLHLANTRSDAHAIYLLNLLLAFLQPKFDPSLEQDLAATNIEEGGEDTEPILPTSNSPTKGDDEEFRPFIRRLPEWQFWCVVDIP